MKRVCKIEGCGRDHQARGYCRNHYQRAKRDGEFGTPHCNVDGCTKFAVCRGMCPMHYGRVLQTGEPGQGASHYQQARFGGRSLHLSTGYMRVGSRLEHRVVMEGVIGRPLLPDEQVHHVNGDRVDNRPDNLELWSTRQPPGQRVTDKVAWAVELLELYAPELLAARPVQLRLA